MTGPAGEAAVARRLLAGRPAGLLVAACLLVTACGGGAAPTVPAGQSPPVVQSPSAAGLKPMIHGLIDRRGVPPTAWLGHIGGFVVNVNWSDLQPAPGVPVAANNAIDQAVAQARSLEAGGAKIAIKIRFFAGINAPEWAKELDGPPVTIFDPSAGRGGTIGRFWAPHFGAAYDAVWQQLAARYDGVAEIREIEVARCGTVFTETFVRDTADPQTVQNLLGAGFTADADQACYRDEIDQGRAWKTTRIGLELNPYKLINPDGSVSNDVQLTLQMMDYCRQQLAAQCVLENNSIRWPPIGGEMAEVYQKMKQLGPPIGFQTATPARVGDLSATLQWAAQEGAAAVELPNDYTTRGLAAFDPVAAALAANPG